MREQIEMPRGTFYIIAGTCAVIILLTSLEMLIRAKDTHLFEMWLSNSNGDISLLGQTNDELYRTYLNMCLSTFFVRVITPMGLALHSYVTLTKLRVSKLYVGIWILLLIGIFLLTTIGETFYSILFIISGIGYLILLLVMISLGKRLYDVRSL
ncbi:MAG: hypothetical protein ACI35O_11235 [Bacillaceae bacterium]